MRRNAIIAVTLLLLVAFGLPLASAESIELFKIDILDDTHTDASYVQDGFVGWAPLVDKDQLNPPAVSETFGGVTITFDVGQYQQDRFRSIPSGTPAKAMYQDSFWGRAADLTDKGLDITLSDLTPGQDYLVALYAYDFADWNGTVSCDWTANGQPAFNASWFADPTPLPTSLDEYKHTTVVEADANGEIVLVSSPGSNHTAHTGYWANCSGLELYAVPEPGTIVSLFGMILGVLCLRRRK